jgi:prepilin-type processing-associated H-X9-DG protein
VLTKGIRWGVFGVSDRPESGFRFVLQASDQSAAKAIGEIGKKVDRMLRTSPAVARFVPDFGTLSDRFAVETAGDRITVTADARAAGMWASTLLKSARMGTTRVQCVNNLKQIGLAMHNYMSVHHTFPPAFSVDKAGKPLLSWRVLILPFLEQEALYNEFHLDEPWDSPHNKALIEKMPALYSCPSELTPKPEAGKTTYVTPRGERTIFPGAVGVKLKEVVDGTATTILTMDVPASEAVVWTKPDDWSVPGTVDPRSLVGRHPDGTNCGFGDGSVHFLSKTIAPAVLKALFTRNGGETVSGDAF